MDRSTGQLISIDKFGLPASVNPAYSLGCGERIGSLEAGKQADIVVFDCPDYRQIPYLFGINHARVVIKFGQVFVDRRTK